MKKAVVIILVLLLVLAVALVAGVIFAPQPAQQVWRSLQLPPAALDWLAERLPARPNAIAPTDQTTAAPTVITSSGTVEAEETTIAAEIGGQVVAVMAEEGQAVAAGQPLVQLDDSLLMAQMAEADQAVALAQASLTAAQAGPRPAQIAAAEAGVHRAQATLAGAQQALADMQRARENPLELDAQINSAAARVTLAKRQIEQERARQAAIVALRQGIAGDDSDQGKTQRAIYEKQAAAAAENIAAAEQEAAGAQRVLTLLRQMRDDPVALDTQVRAAEQQVRLAEAALTVAQAELAQAKAGPQTEAVAVAQAQVAEAEAGRDLLAAQAAKAIIASPLSGVVTTRAIQPGEMALPGAPLLKIADLARVTVTTYIPEQHIGLVRVGQPASVRVDAYPGRVFSGVVNYISPQAQFTPRNIQTPEERTETVFGVKIALDNGDGALKPGMPADVEIPISAALP